MRYYINCIKQSKTLERDIKELIPDMNLRRRMSRVVKTGVSTAMESLLAFDSYGEVDAIITATGLGCMTDSEKFLANILQSGEKMLNPTPFIQSTFNMVGAQVALIKGLHCYNNTFTHRYISFESALIDALLCLEQKRAKAVLVGIFDEATLTVEAIMRRMGLLKNKELGEGALFFVLTANLFACSVAEIEDISFDFDQMPEGISVSQTNEFIWSGAVAETVVDCIVARTDGWIRNDLGGKNNSLIKLRCL